MVNSSYHESISECYKAGQADVFLTIISPTSSDHLHMSAVINFQHFQLKTYKNTKGTQSVFSLPELCPKEFFLAGSVRGPLLALDGWMKCVKYKEQYLYLQDQRLMQ